MGLYLVLVLFVISIVVVLLLLFISIVVLVVFVVVKIVGTRALFRLEEPSAPETVLHFRIQNSNHSNVHITS